MSSHVFDRRAQHLRLVASIFGPHVCICSNRPNDREAVFPGVGVLTGGYSVHTHGSGPSNAKSYVSTEWMLKPVASAGSACATGVQRFVKRVAARELMFADVRQEPAEMAPHEGSTTLFQCFDILPWKLPWKLFHPKEVGGSFHGSRSTSIGVRGSCYEVDLFPWDFVEASWKYIYFHGSMRRLP